MRYCFDLDDTLWERTTFPNYDGIKPIPHIIAFVNKLYNEGHYIILYTARGLNVKELTIKQVKEAGIFFHELIHTKPSADFYIDDKAIRPDEINKFKKP